MNYFSFFKSNTRILLFAVLLTFFSGFGQTFILSLYIPEIIKEFGLSQSGFSTIYALATLFSGLSIVFAGKLIDRFPLMGFTMVVIAGIISANIWTAFSTNLFMLFLGVYMLRFFGQGLLSHTSMTAMGRYFSHARGKALSIAYLGFPFAEILFPVSVVSIIALTGWRTSFGINAAFIFIILTPLAWFLLKNFDKSKIVEEKPTNTLQSKRQVAPKQDRAWRQKDIIRNINFYIFAPTSFITGFILTSLFFFQTFIADFKGWSVEWMALSITAYAIASFIFSILSGPVIDRFSARAIFPFVLLPMAAGLIVLSVVQHPAGAVAFWFLTGITAGTNPTTGNAIYAETYGVKSLGSIRSMFTFVMIISTAAGPVVYSFLLGKSFDYNQIHLLLTGVILANMLFILAGMHLQKTREKISGRHANT